MPGLKDWFEVFRAGTHTDMSGRTVSFGQKDLDGIVSAYKSSPQKAPIVFGHPKHDAPAFGWVDDLKRVGNSLYAKCNQVVEEFENCVKDGLYPNRSISLAPDNNLRHIGFLGAVQPAVKGLEPISFCADFCAVDEGYCFADWQTESKFDTAATGFQRLRDFLIEKYDIETADKVISPWMIDELKRVMQDNPQEAVALFCENVEKVEKNMEEIPLSDTNTNNAPTNKPDNKDFAESKALEEKEKEIQNLKAQLEKQEIEARKAQRTAFCEELIKDGKLLPANKADVLDFMEIMHTAGSFNFSENSEENQGKSAEEKFKEFLKKLPVQIEFGEFATNGTGASTQMSASDIAEKARIYMSEQQDRGVTISVSQAVAKVTENN